MLQVLVLERVELWRNAHRYYVLSVEPTLFGDVAFRREWGRLGLRGARNGRCRTSLHADEDSALVSLQTWLSRKRKRGYVVAAPALGC